MVLIPYSAIVQAIMVLLFEFPSDCSQVVVIKIHGIQIVLFFIGRSGSVQGIGKSE